MRNPRPPDVHTFGASASIRETQDARETGSPKKDRYEGIPYEDMPFLPVLFRYLWPFWLFRDASHGTLYARAAAYQHNRGMRVHLPGYLLRWVISCALALGGSFLCDTLAPSLSDGMNVFVVMAAGSGMLFACGICGLLTLSYVYIYLSQNEQ